MKQNTVHYVKDAIKNRWYIFYNGVIYYTIMAFLRNRGKRADVSSDGN